MFSCLFVLWLTCVLNALSAAASNTKNDDGYACAVKSHTRVGQYCYYSDMSESGNFVADRQQCNKLGGDIVSIHSPEENANVTIVSGGAPYYIGLRNINNELVWADGSEVGYTNFAPDKEIKSGDCYMLSYDGTWWPISCDETYSANGYICKIPAIRVMPSVCPTPGIYYDRGEIYSPEYPQQFDFTRGGEPLQCMYKLAARNGYYIILEMAFSQAATDKETKVTVYEGWTMDGSKLLRYYNESTGGLQLITSKINRMLVVLDANKAGLFSGIWYSTKSVQSSPTGVPQVAGLAETLQPNNKAFQQCPRNNIFNYDSVFESPNSPVGYASNFDCYYYPKALHNETYPRNVWGFRFQRLALGADDFIELIDPRSNTTFASCNVLQKF